MAYDFERVEFCSPAMILWLALHDGACGPGWRRIAISGIFGVEKT